MPDSPRLIEIAFPLKQTSLDSVREKYGPRGHISGFHLWPARRPLAASRAALIATLLPDPDDAEERKRILERLGGKLVQKTKRKKAIDGQTEDQMVEETEGGILRWGRESGPDLDWFRQEIRKAYGGRAPRVLDPFAGGGAIPLEAMRLGCETTAVDINPVAWFILKCTLEYPQRLAGQKRPLPAFGRQDREFMAEFLKTQGYNGASLEAQLDKLGVGTNLEPMFAGMEHTDASLDADLAWHVRAWGRWVLERARADLERYYPTVDGKPTVAYLWARTVKCKNCRATIPLLKTRWLCKKDKKRVVLTMQPNDDKTGVEFDVQTDVPAKGKTPAQRREHDKKIGGGTMSRSGATCPCCSAIMTMQDIRLEGQAGRLGAVMTTVVVDGKNGKEYRIPAEKEIRIAARAERELERVYADIPFGLPNEPSPAGGGSGAGRAFSVQGYGMMQWRDLFTHRQLLALGVLLKHIHASRATMHASGYSEEWIEAVSVYLAASLDRLVDHSTSLATWYLPGENVKHTFVRYALPITWDFAESNPIYAGGGSWSSATTFCSAALEHTLRATAQSPSPTVIRDSAISYVTPALFDLIMTDPPYYDAIPYSDLMDCFYVWLKRSTYGLGTDFGHFSAMELSPKWSHAKDDGELIDDSSRHEGSAAKSKETYENGMFRAFQSCYQALKPDGRLVVVFAHKQPDAWETLVSAMIRAGFVVNASWPIQTENVTRSRARASAALASSVWLVCKKRPEASRPGWDNRVLEEMREKITLRLRDFWDAGIRGPDFVWAATGPALEAYSQYPVVKKANQPGEVMKVSEFLKHVRRIVVDFVVGRVLSGDGDAEAVTGLDSATTYYLLHRHDFGIGDAPAGACILYAVSCSLSDHELADHLDILSRSGGKAEAEEAEEPSEGEEAEIEEGTGSAFRLKAWNQRKRPNMGYDSVLDDAALRPPLLLEMESPVVPSREIPLIDQVHRLMHLWRAGDVVKVDEYLDLRGLRRNTLFHKLLQALIELAPAGSEERSLLESISNHVAGRGVAVPQLFTM